MLNDILTAKAQRAAARAAALLAAAGEPADVCDSLNTGKLTKLVLWRVENILAEHRDKSAAGRRLRLPGHVLPIAAGRETGARAGDFCYSSCKGGDEATGAD